MRKVSLFVFLLVGACLSQTTVEDVARGGSCSTANVKGLSTQLINQMNCLSPGVMKSIQGQSGFTLGSGVFPFLQGPAADALIKAVKNSGETISVNSALRTLPQQYLLYRWNALGLCGITAAAAPGRSNHNGGLAIDINGYNSWITRLKPYGWSWFGNSDKVHFTYGGSGTVDIRDTATRAFQMLWNLNNPDDLLKVDGDYGPNTESRLRQSPAAGFAKTGCSAAKRFNELIESSNITSRDVSKRAIVPCKNSAGNAGTCIDTAGGCSGGQFFSGFCAGPNNIKCCVPTATPVATGLTVNKNGIELIQSFEGFYANFYIDPVGIKTIGYGHACTVSDCNNLQGKSDDGSFYRLYAPLSRQGAFDLLRGDIDNLGFEDCVNKYVTANINSNQFSALISFAFNLGCGALKSSTLLKRVNAQAKVSGTGGIREAFLMWNKAGGKVLPGLTRRRNAEADLYAGTLTLNNRDIVVREIGLDARDPNTDGIGAECWHYGEKGVCIPDAYCTGFTVKGLCPGASNILCCLRKKCDATSVGSQDGQCGLANACSGTVVETANCTGATDLKCCKGTIPEPTTQCPDGATWSTTLRWCQTNDGQFALGPFTRAMISKCSSNGGSDDVCVKKYPFTWNGETINLFKWPYEFAVRIRGSESCMFGSAPNTNYLGYCLESISVVANASDTSLNATIVSQRNVYGAMRPDIQEACKSFAGGLACNTPRWDGDFFRTIAQPFHLSIVPTDETGNTEDSEGASLDTTSNIWVNTQMKLSDEHIPDDAVSGSEKITLICIGVFAFLALLI